jgi:hypothetical protein
MDVQRSLPNYGHKPNLVTSGIDPGLLGLGDRLAYTFSEITERFGFSRTLLTALVDGGQLRCFKVGKTRRVLTADLLNLIDQNFLPVQRREELADEG